MGRRTRRARIEELLGRVGPWDRRDDLVRDTAVAGGRAELGERVRRAAMPEELLLDAARRAR
jgi:hypothetical protein